jgi:hypothetical protein
MTDPDTLRCAAHPNVETNLRCGKCDKPICPRCIVETPVGARCRECARVNKLPTFKVSGKYYIRAAGTALGMAVVTGLIWGFVEAFLSSYFFGVIIAAIIGWAIGQVISLAVNRKRNHWLAVIGGIAVVMSWSIIHLGQLFAIVLTGLDLSWIIFTLVSLAAGIYFAVNRLR